MFKRKTEIGYFSPQSGSLPASGMILKMEYLGRRVLENPLKPVRYTSCVYKREVLPNNQPGDFERVAGLARSPNLKSGLGGVKSKQDKPTVRKP